MRLALLFLITMSLHSLFAERIYFGCPTGIFVSEWKSGILGPAKLAAASENPSFLAVSKNGRFLYSVAEKNTGAVVAWVIADDGTLKKLNDQPSGGADPCHIFLTPNEKILLVANYSGGSIAAFPLQADGTIGSQSSFVQLTGKGPNPNRQNGPHAHGIYCDSAGQTVYVPDLGTDHVWIYALSPDGVLTALEPATLPPGSGPRHLAFSPDGSSIYVNGEMDLTLNTIELKSKFRITDPVLPVGIASEGADTAEIAAHPNEKYLYVSTRGYSSISSFRISPDGGKLSFLDNIPTGVDGPRHFSISPDGSWMVVPGQKANQVAVFALDSDTGKLSPKSKIDLAAPMCAVFAGTPEN